MAKTDDILARVRRALAEAADPHTLASGPRYFKEPIKLHGAKTVRVSALAKETFKEIKNRDKAALFALCEDLWSSGYLEESFIACGWAHALRGRYQPADLDIFERWLEKYVSNWASCDTLCNHAVGAHIQAYPSGLARLKSWARSPNRWLRRAASVSLILPARSGLFLKDILDIASLLLGDGDDLVRKGYGWLLKATSQAHQDEVFAFVMANKARMPRVALRYAIEKMPPDLRARAMEK